MESRSRDGPGIAEVVALIVIVLVILALAGIVWALSGHGPEGRIDQGLGSVSSALRHGRHGWTMDPPFGPA